PASAPPAPKPEPPKHVPPPPPSPAAAPVVDRPRPPATAAPRQGGDGAETPGERLRKKSTPLVRKIAAEHQVDISTIPGTGFAGRVTKQDILGFIDRGAVAPRPAAAVPVGPIAHPVVEPWPGDRVEPFSKIRKITADHMIMSRRGSAHVTSFFAVDYTQIAELRRRNKQGYADSGGSVTYINRVHTQRDEAP